MNNYMYGRNIFLLSRAQERESCLFITLLHVGNSYVVCGNKYDV